MVFFRGYGVGGPKEDYPYRNGPMRSSPPLSAELMPSGGNNMTGGPGRPMQQGAVMMVYGLNNDKMNSERLFNLLCLYGNVVRVSAPVVEIRALTLWPCSKSIFFLCT